MSFEPYKTWNKSKHKIENSRTYSIKNSRTNLLKFKDLLDTKLNVQKKTIKRVNLLFNEKRK